MKLGKSSLISLIDYQVNGIYQAIKFLSEKQQKEVIDSIQQHLAARFNWLGEQQQKRSKQ